MPKQRARDSHQRPIGELDLASLNGLNGTLVDNDLVISGLDEPAGDVLDLLAGLDEEVVALGDLNGNARSRVTSPDVEAGVARTAVDGEEVEVGVEAGEDCVEGGVFVEIGGGRSEEMGAVLEIRLNIGNRVRKRGDERFNEPVTAGVAEVLGFKTKAECCHFRQLGDTVFVYCQIIESG